MILSLLVHLINKAQGNKAINLNKDLDNGKAKNKGRWAEKNKKLTGQENIIVVE